MNDSELNLKFIYSYFPFFRFRSKVISVFVGWTSADVSFGELVASSSKGERPNHTSYLRFTPPIHEHFLPYHQFRFFAVFGNDRVLVSHAAGVGVASVLHRECSGLRAPCPNTVQPYSFTLKCSSFAPPRSAFSWARPVGLVRGSGGPPFCFLSFSPCFS